jgi:hypothetical protein
MCRLRMSEKKATGLCNFGCGIPVRQLGGTFVIFGLPESFVFRHSYMTKTKALLVRSADPLI